MGFQIKFNWALQIEEPSDLKEGNVYDFAKDGNRVFPVETPIDLISPGREAIAKIVVLEFSNSKEETKGKFKVIKIYEGQEREILTNYWIENK